METPARSIEELIERAETYTKTTIELSKLKLLETTNTVITSLIPRLIVFIMALVFAIVLTIGIALYLGELLGKSYWGFFIVSAFYLVATIVLHFFLHKWIKKPLSNFFIKQVLQ